MNKKGFTLIELLVSIAILSIITLIALPAISKLYNSTSTKKFTSYEKALKSSTELYIDSYSEDLFSRKEVDCRKISYNKLRLSNLIKEFNVDNINCNNEDTYVYVNKNYNKYSYDTSLVCKKDDKVVYSSKKEIEDCPDAPDKQGPTIFANPNGKSNWFNYSSLSKKTVTITIEDENNLDANASFKYKWVSSKNDSSTSGYTNVSITNYNTNTVKKVTTEIKIPNDLNGTYYLKIIPIDIRDYLGNKQTYIFHTEAFKIDNINPTCRIDKSTSAWTKNNVTLTIVESDSHSGVSSSGYSWNNNTYNTKKTNTVSSNDSYSAYVKDEAGNMGNCSVSVTNIDKISPTCTSSGGNSSWTNGDRILTGTCGDTGGSGCSSSSITRTISSNTNSTGLGPGDVCDNAGNCVTCPDDQTVKIDKTKPTDPIITNPTQGSWTNSNFQLSVTSSDTHSGISYWQYKYSETKWETYASSNRNTFTTTAFSRERNEDVYIRACDYAGNCSSASSSKIKIDKTKPYTPYHDKDLAINKYGNANSNSKTICYTNWSANCNKDDKDTDITCNVTKNIACGGSTITTKDQVSNKVESGIDYREYKYKCEKGLENSEGYKTGWMTSADWAEMWSTTPFNINKCKLGQTKIRVTDNAGNKSSVYTYKMTNLWIE